MRHSCTTSERPNPPSQRASRSGDLATSCYNVGCPLGSNRIGMLGGICNHIISEHITQFLVFYTPQGGTELSDRVSGVRY